MVNSPTYLTLHIAPEHVKLALRQKIKNPEILGYVDINAHDTKLWKQFIIWTKRQDLYRSQSLQQVAPEFFNLIKQDWDSITDLSESNFYD
jgi:hypothetical protein